MLRSPRTKRRFASLYHIERQSCMDLQTKDDMNIHLSTRRSTSDRRIDMPWTSLTEGLLLHISKECQEESKVHGFAGHFYTQMYTVLALPTVVLPLVTGMLENTSISKTYPMVITTLLTVIGTLTGVQTFINAGAASNEHTNTENMFMSLANDISICLSKPRQFREPSDVVLERVRLKYQFIQNSAPNLPKICCSKKTNINR